MKNEVKGIKYRIKQKSNVFFPQWEYGIRTMWSWEYVSDLYMNFIELNKIKNQDISESGSKYWTMFFYREEDAQKYIDDVLKPKHYNKYYSEVYTTSIDITKKLK